MAGHITIAATHDGTLEPGTVRDALLGLDVSQSSPVSEDGSEVGTAFSGSTVTLTVAGYDGDFTKKSQDSIKDALASIESVDADSVSVEDGGYTPDSE